MSIETKLPYSWLRTLSPDLKMLDESHVWGSPPPFPWNEYGKALSQIFDVPEIKIEATQVEWSNPDQLLAKSGQNPVFHAFSVPPLEGNAYLLFSKEDLKQLLYITTQDKVEEEWLREWSEEWQDEFYQFLLLQAIHAFKNVKYDPSLSPQVLDDTSLPTTPCLCIDFTLSTPNQTVGGRLIISPEMRKSLKQKYISNTLSYPQNFIQSVITTVHVVVGSTTISKEEWQKARPGDFLLLDSCTLAPGEEKGRVVLTVNNTPIFRAKLKDNSLKLLEYPLLQEVQTPMAKQHDEEFDDTFETEDESLSQQDHDIDPFEEEETMEAEDNSLELSEEDLEEEIGEEPEEKAPGLAGKDLLEKKVQPERLVKLEEIPLTISIEIARIQMSMAELQELAPGNLLDLNITPENGVDLIVNGHCIGKGELLKLGETLGIRILDKA